MVTPTQTQRTSWIAAAEDDLHQQVEAFLLDRLLACFEYEYMIRTQYVLRDDGTLWRWKIEIYPYGQVARFIQIMALSLVIGLVAGIVIVTNKRH